MCTSLPSSPTSDEIGASTRTVESGHEYDMSVLP
jgi:hypothetical protein